MQEVMLSCITVHVETDHPSHWAATNEVQSRSAIYYEPLRILSFQCLFDCGLISVRNVYQCVHAVIVLSSTCGYDV